MSVDIDDAFYSRQRYVLGDDAMVSLTKAHVYIYGLGGVGVECAKNLVLAGVKQITLDDINVCTKEDLGTQFYIREAHIREKLTRAEASLPELAVLNPYVEVSLAEKSLASWKFPSSENVYGSLLKEVDCLVLTDCHLFTATLLNAFCRRHGIRFVYTNTIGVLGNIFCDFGQDFTVYDQLGRPLREFLVSGITNEETPKLTPKGKDHLFLSDGDTITFRDVSGMTELNGRTATVKVTSATTLQLDIDTRTFGKFSDIGVAVEHRKPASFSFEPIWKQIVCPDILSFDESKPQLSTQAHYAFLSLMNFYAERGTLPAVWSESDADKVVKIAKSLQQSDTEVGCGAIGCEILKLLALMGFGTGPLSSAEMNDANSIVVEQVNNSSHGGSTNDWFFDGVSFPPRADTRDLTAIFEALSLRIIEHTRTPEIGASGHQPSRFGDTNPRVRPVGVLRLNSDGGTDRTGFSSPDGVFPLSPLIADVNAFGERAAAANDSETPTNSDLHGIRDVSVSEPAVFETPRNIFYRPNLFFSQFTLKPRVTEKLLSAFDSSVLRIKDAVLSIRSLELQPFICRQHEIYPPAVSSHAAYTSTQVEVIRKFDDPQANFLLSRPTSFAECVTLARTKFDKYFNHKARHLLEKFPEHARADDGTAFWQLPRRRPTPLTFSSKDPLHVQFVWSFARLLAQQMGLQCPQADDRSVATIVEQYLSDFIPQPYAPSTKEIITDPTVRHKPATEAVRLTLPTLLQRLNSIDSKYTQAKVPKLRCVPTLFEKDDEVLGHVDFVDAAANLRALMYGLPLTPRHEVKRIAGRIIPAIATTTAVVAGLVCVEILKFFALSVPLSPKSYDSSLTTLMEAARNHFVNLAVPSLLSIRPSPCQRQSLPNGVTFSTWDRWAVAIPPDATQFSLSELITTLKVRYGLSASLISQQSRVIYMNGFSAYNHNLSQPLLSLLRYTPEDSYVDLIVAYHSDCAGEEDSDFPAPTLRILLPHASDSGTNS
nr:unnamed protein product [Spirometra erinaceieuropaei]